MQDFFTASLFSMELVSYIVKDDLNPSGIYIDPNVQQMGEPFFKGIIGEAVRAILEDNEDIIFKKYKEFKKLNAKNFQIIEWTMNCSHRYFQNGYDHKSFLFFCGLVVGLADLFFVHKSRDVTLALCNSIASVLSAFLLTREFKDKGGWDGLYECAAAILKKYDIAYTKYV